MSANTKTKNCHVIDLSQAPYTTFGMGIRKENPKRCLNCGQPIKRGETWTALTSAVDAEGVGRYRIVRHSPRCPARQTRPISRQARLSKVMRR